ncbi:MAG: hypothetical protein WAT22_11390 [Saprospiraceae bacterium]
MKYTLLLIILLSITSCSVNKISNDNREYFEYELNFKGFEWDANPYKFTNYIKDSVFHVKGAQNAAWDFSYIGDIESMHKMWDSNAKERNPLTQEQKDSFALFVKRDALEYISEQAKNQQVIIINESHHMPQHRVFTTQLLDSLYKLGFRHLGLETYLVHEKADSILQYEGYPTLKSGYYTKEPQFGNLVRAAHKKGFKIFGYESNGHTNGKEREINQAKNIHDYIKMHPNEKILIHCGFDHGYEGELSNQWEKAMAGRLTEYTGINPLTINQVIYSEKSKLEFENPYYQLSDLNYPSVFINSTSQVFGEYKNGAWFDIAIFHPRSKKINRPSWMIYGNRNEVSFSFEKAEIECPCLVFAYKKGEKIGYAIPYDIQETLDKKVNLVLDKSDFEIVIWNQNRKALKTELKNKY